MSSTSGREVERTDRVVEYTEAIDEAIHQAMHADDDVITFGEDIEINKPAIKAEFPDRIRNVPISETAFIGMGTGAAFSGMRPIVDLTLADFFAVAFDQIINHMAKTTYFSNGQLSVPVVLRLAYGGGYRDGGQHQQCLYSLFGHVPGMKVVVPSTPYEGKGMMAEAITQDDPVVFFEHKLLSDHWLSVLAGDERWPDGMHEQFEVPLAGNRGPVPEEPYTVPFEADVKRDGSDVTIVTVGTMVHRSLEVAERLAADRDVDVEVVDLRSLVPLDESRLIESVRKTGRLVVVDEDHLRYGLTGEIAAIVAERAYDALDAPIRRIGAEMTPIPFSPPLEDRVLPSSTDIESAVRAVTE